VDALLDEGGDLVGVFGLALHNQRDPRPVTDDLISALPLTSFSMLLTFVSPWPC
jgi:hypothetical protein